MRKSGTLWTDGHCDLKTEVAQWAASVKTFFQLTNEMVPVAITVRTFFPSGHMTRYVGVPVNGVDGILQDGGHL